MMPRTTIAISGILLAGFVIPAQAQLDTLGNGMSDVWERYYNNGELFDPENPDHHPDADPDGDGWTNMQEYIAGTDPFSANPPEGFIPTYITYLENQEMPDPDDESQTIITDVAIISWDTIPGKTYTLWSSPDLTPDSWVMADGPVMGDGDPWASPILLSHAFEETPERLFWRLEIQDPHIDSDGDGLTDYEEYLLGSNPFNPDTSGDGVPDRWLAAHGFSPLIHHSNIDFPGLPGISVVDAYNMGVQEHQGSNPDDLDGDGVPNGEDAAPLEPAIQWARTNATFVFIPAPADITQQHVILGDDSSLSYPMGNGEHGPIHGYWKPGDTAGTVVPQFVAGVVTDPNSSENLTLQSTGLMYHDDKWDAHLGYPHPTDLYFGDVILRKNSQIHSFRRIRSLQGHWPENITWFGFDRAGRAYLAANQATYGEDHVYVIDTSGNVDDLGRRSVIDYHYSNHSFASNGWLRVADKLYSPDNSDHNLPVYLHHAVLSPLPGLAAALLTNGILHVKYPESDKIKAPASLSGRSIVSTTASGLLLDEDAALWANGDWIDFVDWAPTKLQDLVPHGGSVRFTDTNSNGVILVRINEETSGHDPNVQGYGLLIPVEAAPGVLPVNSNFDEGRIDPDNGYAIPDCDDMPGVCPVTGAGNTKMALEAYQDHLDGKYTKNERITNNLHEGWFGVHPKTFGDEFWHGATVEIKKIAKIDSDTGQPESGQVRFYAKWGDGPSEYRGIPTYDPGTLEAANLVTGGINNAPGESVYGANSIIPENAVFYMEGIRPGKITLEWRYEKGDVELSYEQTFVVVTKKTRTEWQKEIIYQIRLQSSYSGNEIDVSQFNPNNQFVANTGFINAIYSWYEQIFDQSNDGLIWAGMAKMAGATVYAAMSDAEVVRIASPGIGVEITALQLQRALMHGNNDIFNDLGWKHRAFIASGYLALEHVSNSDQSPFPGTISLEDWLLIHKGIHNQSVFDSSLGSRGLLFREQSHVVDPVYSAITQLQLDSIISVLAKNPIPNLYPLGKNFSDTVPNGSLSEFDHRWSWIASDMYPGWTGISQFALDLGIDVGGQGSGGYDSSERLIKAAINLSTRSRLYSLFPNSVP